MAIEDMNDIEDEDSAAEDAGMPDVDEAQEAAQAPKAPTRRRSFAFKKDEVIDELLKWYDQDLQDRQEWSDRRLQRYAKYRGWLEQKDFPWPDASNVFIPLMMTDSQQMQDTLSNGVLSQRPVMAPQAVNPADREKCETIAQLLDYQLMVEQMGEKKFANLIESFVNDGTMYSLQTWITDEQDTEQVEYFPPLEPGVPAEFQLKIRIEGIFKDQPAASIDPTDAKEPWTWDVKWFDENHKEHTARVEFYTHDDGRLLCIVKRRLAIFDGPCVIPKSEEDIVFPSRAENLQPPSPSNPSGAHHVFIVDYPSKDEIKRLMKSKYYDLATPEDLERLSEEKHQASRSSGSADDPEQHKIQRDALAGQTFGNADVASGVYTRLMCFARWDVDGDGLDENVVFWVLKEHRLVLRARLLSEFTPLEGNKRPLMSEQFIEVPGQIRGIGLLELLEHIQDAMKILVDQTIDKNTLVNTPWFAFRASSGVRPEVIRMAPGEGYPMANPQQDIVFPQIPNPDQTLSLNMLAVFNQWAERQVVIGELQFGRVPQGKASALRTTSGMQAVLQQGAARPERLIRRFFLGLAEIYSQCHELNGVYLKPKKQYRILGMSTPGADPYRTVDDPSKVKGKMVFEFKANSLNTNKAFRSQVLKDLGAITFNPMTFQMGLVTHDNFYNWLQDMWKDSGQDPNRYVNPPSPQSSMPKITAEQAIGLLYQGYIPEQLPAEGPQIHMQRVQQLMQQLQQEGTADASFMVLARTYLQKVQGYAQQAQLLAQQAAQFASMMSGGGGQGGAQPGGGQSPEATQAQPQGQLLDESLPSNQGAMGGF